MELIPLAEAAPLAAVSPSTLRNYIAQSKLTAYKRGSRVFVEKEQVIALFQPRADARRDADNERHVPPDNATTGAAGIATAAAAADAGRAPGVVAVANQKGGVGKTTTAVSLAVLLAQMMPTLAIDCDPQGNLTQALGLEPDAQERTLYNVLLDEIPLEGALLTLLRPAPSDDRTGETAALLPHLDLVPANLDLADIWRRVAGRVALEALLKNALAPLRGRYGAVILDCPPSLDATTLNCLVAADTVIVPVDMSLFSVRGMVKLTATMNEVRKVNPDLPPPRILACRTEHTTVSRSIEENLRARFGSDIFSAAIPKSKDVQASQFARIPLPLYTPQSRVVQAYRDVVRELTGHQTTTPAPTRPAGTSAAAGMASSDDGQTVTTATATATATGEDASQ